MSNRGTEYGEAQSIIPKYIAEIAKALKEGNATEHTHRPTLKKLVESLRPELTATNEPQRIECGAPDFIVSKAATPIGYLEAKDVGINLDRAEESEQLRRYRSALRNLILTDYLEFRLFRNGELVATVQVATIARNGAFRPQPAAVPQLHNLLQAFFDADIPTVTNPRELAERMARVARLLHDLIRIAFTQQSRRGDLLAQYEAFRKVLIGDLTVDQFADMYAQTIAYGLFAARCNHSGPGFTREHAGTELPRTNPFLRKLFNTIAGPDLDDRIAWAVDDLAELLARADTDSILKSFGTSTRQHDPVVHFYETFLSAYDPKMRELRGVYYTPEPVVGYIVRSVDAILRHRFNLPSGLADRSTVRLQVAPPSGARKAREITTHRVQILDPACGTGTFLHAVVSQVHDSFSRSRGLWPAYVAQHLLPRLYGFELLMAPYAVAHMKLGIELKQTGYDFATDERLRVFLTNSLEEAHEFAGLPLFAQWLADEAAAASEVKRAVPIMVVLGNPPYSGHSANKGEWIEHLMETYKQSAELRRPAQAKWLSDDYVKFIRFAQWRIEQTGYGVLGFITNHSWLDNPTFLDMRASLMSTFDELYVLDLHGSTKRNDTTPSGDTDENVFDIQQGVAISVFVRSVERRGGATHIHHGDLWGLRETKYEWLEKHDVLSTQWNKFTPLAPRRIFVPQDEKSLAEYDRGVPLRELMHGCGDPAPGIVTTHDEFAISWTREEAAQKVERLLNTTTEDEARALWRLCSQSQWNYQRAKAELSAGGWRDHIVPIQYRPFDQRWTVYDRNVAVHRRERVTQDMLGLENIGLVTCRQVAARKWCHALVSDLITDDSLVSNRTKERGYLLPIRVLDREGDDLFASVGAHPTFNANAIRTAAELLKRAVSDEELLSYVYAVLYAPSYRSKYASFLKRDFPRVPLTTNAALFSALIGYGKRLIDLHLMRETAPVLPGFPVAGNNSVERVTYDQERIYVNAEQYFDTVPRSVWEYEIGAYQVAHKWLKDRKGRLLSFNDLDHYRRVIGALRETIKVQEEIDRTVPEWPLR